MHNLHFPFKYNLIHQSKPCILISSLLDTHTNCLCFPSFPKMDRIQNWVRCSRNRYRYLVGFFALILIPSMTQDASMAQGRPIMTTSIEATAKGLDAKIGEKNVAESSLIGSRPPRCETRCRNCGSCEAIQVPVTPQQRLKPSERGTHSLQNSTSMTEYTRGDDTTNYKPVSWRCKCGDYIFNP